jgi:aminocarboxymuconate-semialdehyde decarboxylase
LGGVLDRHADLHVCLAHGGGLSPAVVGRLQRGYDAKRPSVDLQLSTPQTIARRALIDCIVHDPNALQLAAEVFGEGNVLFGSDWPFPMGLPDPHVQLAGIAANLRKGIFNDNVTRFGG